MSKFIGGKALMDSEPKPEKKILGFGEAPSRPQQSSQPSGGSQLPEPPTIGHESSQLPHSSLPSESSQLRQSNQPPPSQPINLMASLPEVRGHLEVPHLITDHLYRHLDVYEQAAFGQLYRLSWGFGSPSCFISNPRLAERSNMSLAMVKKVVGRLVDKGLIRKTGNVQGFGKAQGVEYEVASPKWQSQRSSQLQQSRQPRQSSQPQQSPNKKEEKEIDKEALAHCPDCYGTGYWYPGGTDKGVARCKHEKLSGES